MGSVVVRLSLLAWRCATFGASGWSCVFASACPVECALPLAFCPLPSSRSVDGAVIVVATAVVERMAEFRLEFVDPDGLRRAEGWACAGARRLSRLRRAGVLGVQGSAQLHGSVLDGGPGPARRVRIVVGARPSDTAGFRPGGGRGGVPAVLAAGEAGRDRSRRTTRQRGLLAQREQVKAEELAAAGRRGVSVAAVRRKRQRYEARGLPGVVDWWAARTRSVHRSAGPGRRHPGAGRVQVTSTPRKRG